MFHGHINTCTTASNLSPKYTFINTILVGRCVRGEQEINELFTDFAVFSIISTITNTLIWVDNAVAIHCSGGESMQKLGG